MKLFKLVLGSLIAVAASSSMAIASCYNCVQQCEGLYGGEYSICLHKCLAENDCPPGGS
ncbi:hypothetical protein V0U79_05465 [Hyphobacterium sp. HN65]|uniref:Uncharacterized protein n=1 Tax=Hyphobacterium lacteum TaxID=3116575 RepID=A0ABU7LPI2_9PROT|nr:hypothetical protein [Hyphobacterium sp. HN65]MEE2525807.1 hypothetical protein [Hyphobacterium sp. HN65]